MKNLYALLLFGLLSGCGAVHEYRHTYVTPDKVEHSIVLKVHDHAADVKSTGVLVRLPDGAVFVVLDNSRQPDAAVVGAWSSGINTVAALVVPLARLFVLGVP